MARTEIVMLEPNQTRELLHLVYSFGKKHRIPFPGLGPLMAGVADVLRDIWVKRMKETGHTEEDIRQYMGDSNAVVFSHEGPGGALS